MAGLPQEGQAFGRYDIDRRIGRGGMGVVYAAVQRGLGREVALKVLSSDLADNEDYRHRFLREAEVLARLDSPHIIAVHDAGEQDGWLYIATQLVPDGDLQALLNGSGPLDPIRALDLTAQVADGIESAHQAGIIHRDIKPSNVLLRRRGGDEFQAYVCDLGISRVLDSQHTKTQGVIGTFAYMAPERHEGLDATEASDVYALGCLLWATLSGVAPYQGTDGQVLLGHLNGPIPQVPGNDPRSVAINAILRRSMAKSPGERHHSAAAFQAACEAAATLGVSSPSVPPPPPGWPAPQQFPPSNQPAASMQAARTAKSAGRQHQSGPQQRSGPQTERAFSAAPPAPHQWSSPPGAGSGGDNRMTWTLAGLAALIVVIGVVVIVALSMSGEPATSGPGEPETPANVADAPDDATTDDFCEVFTKINDAPDFGESQPYFDDLKRVGTPADVTVSQRHGFEELVTLAENSESKDDYQSGMSDLSPSDNTDVYSFLGYGRTTCN